ncbi:hypothetical protein NQ095_07730 [Rossellomorea sp. SC111]|uniref:hypothetical protein n=1 Tax=Rossellomorea sp. SC111 TaxID=2968985 RepID=UPI00215B66F9|nr:hypothetical protein [Rossellomorea sp. SC111]MCR8848288.1 hypothetical protein [Rossellomorea sp. SC111]
MEKKKGLIPSIIFGSIILLSILALAFFIYNGESILEGIKDGFTDEGSMSVQIINIYQKGE